MTDVSYRRDLVATDGSADLGVVGSHGRNAPCPVLVVRPERA